MYVLFNSILFYFNIFLLFFLDRHNLQNSQVIIRLLLFIYFYINVFSKNRINTTRVFVRLNLSKLFKLNNSLLFCVEEFLNILLFCNAFYLFIITYLVFLNNITFILFSLIYFAYRFFYFILIAYSFCY